MHASSLENMRRCYQQYVLGTELEERGGYVLDVGGADVNGSYRSIFPGQFEYRTADIGPDVDLVLADPYSFPIDDGSVDIVLSGQAFEHIEYFWRTFDEMVRVLKPDGLIFLIAPSAGPAHRYPVDCYRFYPDAYAALAKRTGCDLVEIWCDERGPWRDLVGVFRRRGARMLRRAHAASGIGDDQTWSGEQGTAAEERLSGRQHYLSVLERLHQILQAQHYIEIGVRAGASLFLAKCSAIGVDPNPILSGPPPDGVTVVAKTSDEFFAGASGLAPFDFGFIDGLHVFEQALRDFMNIERHARPGAVVVIDDIFPNHPSQAERRRKTRAWTGDVWKLVEVLSRYRPDLHLVALDTSPAGLLLVAGLDPSNRVLWDLYNPIVREWSQVLTPPDRVLAREGALDPGGQTFENLIAVLAAARRDQLGLAETRAALVAGASNRLPLSVVIVAFNMARELPRTIRSFSPEMQLGIAAGEYELIVVDNGSTRPFNETEVRSAADNVVVHYMTDAGVSPVAAINKGLAMACGELVGVCIDGARMASPGLLAAALQASRLHPRPVIGSVAFHLGPKVQMQSVKEGYSQSVEDELLRRSGWEEDGYRLFEISVFAGSSSAGWFVTPAETNALFMRAEHWRDLGGYDPGFVTPGGGLANLDTWKRACEDPSSELIMLLGEATFHQVHGGVATNSPVSKLDLFHEEYMRLRGKAFERTTRAPRFYGALNRHAMASVKASMR